MPDYGDENRKQVQTEGTGSSGTVGPSPIELVERWTEILSALILGLVAIATAWSGYQSARWGGEQATKYKEAGSLRVDSTGASILAGQQMQIDIVLFSNWVDAFANENARLEAFYRERFRAEFVPAFEAWVATDPENNPEAPPSPFAMTEYQLAASQQAEDLERKAEDVAREGTEANERSDQYVLNTVILASVLFFAGIAPRFDWLPVRAVVIAVALILLVLGLYNIATYPVS